MGKKFIKFCREKYKTLIPLMVVLVLLITLYFLYREYKYDNYRDRREVEVYQVFGGIKTEYTAIITYNLKGNIVGVEAKNKKIEYDATPIYYKDKEEVLFPEEMIVAMPLREGSQYRVYKYSSYINDDSINKIRNGLDTGNNTLMYYDYASGESEVIEIEGKNVSVRSEYINVNLTERYFTSFNERVLLSRPYNLQGLYKSN